MKFRIGTRLFLAVMASFLVIGLIGVELVRWQVLDSTGHMSSVDVEVIDQLAERVARHYKEHHDWSFLPADAAQRKAWLGEQIAQLQAAAVSAASQGAASPGLAHRVGLLDGDRELIAGAIPHRMLIAIASIDTVERGVSVDDQVVGKLVVARAESPGENLTVAFLIEQQRNLVTLAAFSLSLAVAAAALLAANFRRPILQLVDGARRLGAGQFEMRLNMRRTDELGELGRTFDQLALQLQNAEEMRRQWVANTSHELRTPLAVLRAQLEALQDGVRAPTPENIALVFRQVVALGKLIDDLRALTNSDAGQLHYARAEVDVWQTVLEVLQGFGERLTRAGLAAITGTPPPQATVLCDEDRLRQVLTNLLENCVRYTQAGGRVEVSGTCIGPQLHIMIDDTAPGVPPTALPRLGERFYRVDASRSRQLGGTGLGLALSRQILEAQGGRLAFSASPLGGLRATIVLALEG
jgi:two-component system, OmpR family, sensor histidine kinase BaeS